MYLYTDKNLNPRTIYGYRSAISGTLKSLGRDDIPESGEISSMMRSFGLERPPKRKLLPNWNLSIVLKALLKPPFEPIATCSLRYLTWKTTFLVALASGRRRSEIHALCFDSDHFKQNQDQTILKLYPDPNFVPKNQAANTIASPIRIPALTNVHHEEPDRLLCPVRALLQYRKVTLDPKVRRGRRKLFISYKPAKDSEIAKPTISSWVCKTVKYAYEFTGAKPEVLETLRISAHEVRALSASWSVMSASNLDSVMEACTWRGKNTFTDFYLRDMCSIVDDMHSLGEVVTGQSIAPVTRL